MTDRQAWTGRAPWQLSLRDWKGIALRAWREQSEDNIALVAAGVAFYAFVALVPLLGALVLSYGLVASPETVLHNVRQMTQVMPGSAAKLIGEQLLHIVDTSDGKKGVGLLVALAIALFGARGSAGAIISALDITFEVPETRSFLRVNLLALVMTVAAVLCAILMTIAVTVIGNLADLVPALSDLVSLLCKVVSYALLAAVGAAMAATLYRFGPARHDVRWQWLTPGSLLATAGWMLLTLGFSIYVARFASYDATYGSLSAVIVLLTWIYLSAYVFLLGAELNCELEKTVGAKAATPTPSVPTPPAAPKTEVAAASPSSLVAAGTASVLGHRAAGGRGAKTVALLGGIGFALLRRQGRATTGAVLIALAAVISILGRENSMPSAD